MVPTVLAKAQIGLNGGVSKYVILPVSIRHEESGTIGLMLRTDTY